MFKFKLNLFFFVARHRVPTTESDAVAKRQFCFPTRLNVLSVHLLGTVHRLHLQCSIQVESLASAPALVVFRHNVNAAGFHGVRVESGW